MNIHKNRVFSVGSRNADKSSGNSSSKEQLRLSRCTHYIINTAHTQRYQLSSIKGEENQSPINENVPKCHKRPPEYATALS